MRTTQLTVGTMNFGGRTDEAESARIMVRALEQGFTHFDTANVYNDGKSERIVGQVLKADRKAAKIATKVGLLRRNGKPEGLKPERIRQALSESLERLGTDYVDLYYLHAPDAQTPFEQTLEAISDLMKSGQVRAWGVSNFAAWQILELDTLCDKLAIERPRASQVLYNLLVRQLELEYFAFASKHPIKTVVYNPLAGGLLARALDNSAPAGSRLQTNSLYRARYGSQALRALAQQYAALAQEEGMTLLSLAYRFLVGRNDIASILVGPGSVAHFEEAVAATAEPLPESLRQKLDALHLRAVGTDASYRR